MVTTGGAHLDRDQGQKVVAEHMGVMISNKMVITNFKTKDHIEIAHHHHYKFKREVKLISNVKEFTTHLHLGNSARCLSGTCHSRLPGINLKNHSKNSGKSLKYACLKMKGLANSMDVVQFSLKIRIHVQMLCE